MRRMPSLPVFPALYFLTLKYTYLAFSQLWFPTVQEVLQADWQDVWHSPQPPFFIVSFRFFVVNVLILFTIYTILLSIIVYIVAQTGNIFKQNISLFRTIAHFFPKCSIPPSIPPKEQRKNAGITPEICVKTARLQIMDTVSKTT